MSRFIALLNASDPDLLTNIENAGGKVIWSSEPGFLVLDGDQSVADAVSQLQAVQAVGPVDGVWDTSQLSLGDDVGSLVGFWNTSFNDDYQAAFNNPYRNGETWDFPGGCDPNMQGDGGGDGGGGPVVADNGGTGDGTTATGDGTTATGDGTTATGDGTGGQVASNDPPADGGTGDSWNTGSTNDGQGEGEQA